MHLKPFQKTALELKLHMSQEQFDLMAKKLFPFHNSEEIFHLLDKIFIKQVLIVEIIGPEVWQLTKEFAQTINWEPLQLVDHILSTTHLDLYQLKEEVERNGYALLMSREILLTEIAIIRI